MRIVGVVVLDGDPVEFGADIPLDALHQLPLRELQILQPAVDVSLPLGIEQPVPAEAIDEPLDFPRGNGFLFEIDHLDRGAALFEKSLRRPRSR